MLSYILTFNHYELLKCNLKMLINEFQISRMLNSTWTLFPKSQKTNLILSKWWNPNSYATFILICLAQYTLHHVQCTVCTAALQTHFIAMQNAPENRISRISCTRHLRCQLKPHLFISLFDSSNNLCTIIATFFGWAVEIRSMRFQAAWIFIQA